MSAEAAEPGALAIAGVGGWLARGVAASVEPAGRAVLKQEVRAICHVLAGSRAVCRPLAKYIIWITDRTLKLAGH